MLFAALVLTGIPNKEQRDLGRLAGDKMAQVKDELNGTKKEIQWQS